MNPRFHDINYSVRRYFVDEFFSRQIKEFSSESRILDIGGKRTNKRGQFDIEDYPLEVRYANIDEKTAPDCLCNITDMPFSSFSFDGVICSEVLEHVKEPAVALKEICRVLKPGGILLLTAPFLIQVHADPHDYGRYTGQYWREHAIEAGFQHVKVEEQGLYFSVMVEMFRCWIQNVGLKSRFVIWRWFLKSLTAQLRKRAFVWEKGQKVRKSIFYQSYTTGYGIAARK